MKYLILSCLLLFVVGCSGNAVDRPAQNFIIHQIYINGDDYFIKTSDEFFQIKVAETVIFNSNYSTSDDILQCEVTPYRYSTIRPINGKYVLLLQQETIDKLKSSVEK